ncbi:hypothetical protein ACFL6O_02180 [candidate division KSB1 bacterium]
MLKVDLAPMDNTFLLDTHKLVLWVHQFKNFSQRRKERREGIIEGQTFLTAPLLDLS